MLIHVVSEKYLKRQKVGLKWLSGHQSSENQVQKHQKALPFFYFQFVVPNNHDELNRQFVKPRIHGLTVFLVQQSYAAQRDHSFVNSSVSVARDKLYVL